MRKRMGPPRSPTGSNVKDDGKGFPEGGNVVAELARTTAQHLLEQHGASSRIGPSRESRGREGDGRRAAPASTRIRSMPWFHTVALHVGS